MNSIKTVPPNPLPTFAFNDLTSGQRFTSRVWSKHKSWVKGDTPYSSTISRMPLGRSFLSTVDCHAPMHVELEGCKTRATLYLPLSGSMEISAAGYRLAAGPGAPALLPARTAHTFDATPIRCVLLEIPAAKLAGEVASFVGQVAPVAPVSWDRNSMDSRAFCALVDLLLADLRTGKWARFADAYTRRMEPLLVGCIARAVAGQLNLLPAGQPQIGKLTMEEVRAWIEVRLRLNFKPAELAVHARLGLRRLQSVFLKHFNKTIMEYLRERRLEAARAELLAPSGSKTISDIAAGLQFHHLSRFAEAYRRQFGELPSITRKKGIPK